MLFFKQFKQFLVFNLVDQGKSQNDVVKNCFQLLVFSLNESKDVVV